MMQNSLRHFTTSLIPTKSLLPLAFALLLGFLTTQKAAAQGPQQGAVAPQVTGTDQNGTLIDTKVLAEKGPVMLFFYRGNWCPYCKKHLSHLQDSLQLLLDRGVNVIAITPETPEAIEKMTGKTDATFSIIHDKDYAIMQAYDVDFKLDKETTPYFGWVQKKTRVANANEDDILPVPATYLIGQGHTVRYRHYNTDYKYRATVKDILSQL